MRLIVQRLVSEVSYIMLKFSTRSYKLIIRLAKSLKFRVAKGVLIWKPRGALFLTPFRLKLS